MDPLISVVVRIEAGDAWPARLMRSLDVQTLSPHAYEILLVLGLAAQSPASDLRRFAEHRPNVIVVEEPFDDAGIIERTGGAWILDLGRADPETDMALFPEALARMVSHGEDSGSDAVLGRMIIRSSRVVNDLFVASGADHAGGLTSWDGFGSTQAVTRAHAVEHGLEPSDLPRVAVLTEYPTGKITGVAPQPEHSVDVATHDITWRDGCLLVSVELRPAELLETDEVVVSVQEVRSGLEYWIPTNTTRVDDLLLGTAEVDLRTAALGAPLPNGLWRLNAGVHGRAPRWSSREVLDLSDLAPAVIAGRPVLPTALKKSRVLGVGAVRDPLVGTTDPSASAITGSARGTVLTVALPDIVVAGDFELLGQLLVGSRSLPARVIGHDGRAELECYLSGLPGSYALSTRFGSPQPTPLGLVLTISALGKMTVAAEPVADGEPERSTRDEDEPESSDPAPPVGEGGDLPLVRRLRRRVPTAAEPAVRRLSRNPLARRVYRALSRLPG